MLKYSKSFKFVLVTALFIIFSGSVYAEVVTLSEVGSCDLPAAAYDVAISGNYAYVTTYDSKGLRVINISDPAHPAEVGSLEIAGSSSGVAISGSFAYVATGSSLRIININDPANPFEAGIYDDSNHISSVAVRGNYAFVSPWWSDTFKVLNISDPANVTVTGSCKTKSPNSSIVLSGDYAFLANGEQNLNIINIHTLSAPTEVGTYWGLYKIYSLFLNGDYAYVAGIGHSGDGFHVVNVSDPASPVKTGTCVMSAQGIKMVMSGNYVYAVDINVTDSLSVINISDPAQPYKAGAYDSPSSSYGFRSVAVSGNYIYAVGIDLGLRVFQAAVVTPTITPTSGATPTPTPVPPYVKSMVPRNGLVSSQLNVSLQGNSLAGISAVKLQNSKTSQMVSGSNLEVSGNSLTAQFNLPDTAGLFDLVLTNTGLDYVFKTLFTVLNPQAGQSQWQMDQLAKAGNAGSTGSIVIGDADRNNETEVYVTCGDHIVSKLKKKAWSQPGRLRHCWIKPEKSFNNC